MSTTAFIVFCCFWVYCLIGYFITANTLRAIMKDSTFIRSSIERMKSETPVLFFIVFVFSVITWLPCFIFECICSLFKYDLMNGIDPDILNDLKKKKQEKDNQEKDEEK